MKRMIQISLLLLTVGLTVAPALAQDDPLSKDSRMDGIDGRDPGVPPFPMSGPTGEGPGRQFQQFRMQKMIEMLELNEAQQQTMKQVFDKHVEQIRKLEEESRLLLDELVPLVKSKSTDEASIAKILVKLDSLDARRDQMRTQFKAEADKSLTIIQRAKLRVFEQRFERQMIKKVRGMHDRRGGPGGPMTPPPMDNDSEG